MTRTMSFPLSWHSAFLFPVEQSKRETVKMMGARSKINTISLNVKINKPKLVDMCGYKLPINVQTYAKWLGQNKNMVESHRGLLFLSHPVYILCVHGRKTYTVKGLMVRYWSQHCLFVDICSASLGQVYDQHQDEDGFLYVAYSSESTFGWCDRLPYWSHWFYICNYLSTWNCCTFGGCALL